MDISSGSGGFDSFVEGAAALFVVYWLLASLSSFVVEIFSSVFNIRGNALRLFIIDTPRIIAALIKSPTLRQSGYAAAA